MTLQDTLNDPQYAELFETPNREEYKEWIIYDQEESTIASRTAGTNSVDVLHVKGTGSIYRQAMKLRIDEAW